MCSRAERPGACRGFVLLEAVVALLVVGLAAAGALELFAAHARAATREPALLAASALAQDRLAAVRLLDPEALRRLPDSVAQGQFASPFAAFRWHATAERARDEATLYDVRVEIRWVDGIYALGGRVSVPAAPATSRRRT